MRLLFCSAALLGLALLVVACDTVDPSECWPNTSGGFGGSGSIPIGAGVGVTSGAGDSPPPPNPCVEQESTPPPAPSGKTCPPTSSANGGGSAGAGAGADTYDTCSGAVWSFFQPSTFSFVTIVADDGEGLAGGWQEATTVLTFADGMTTIYSCQAHVGMPLRAQLWGKVPPAFAAGASATAANEAAAGLWPTPFPQGIFCSKFKLAMQTQFDKQYPMLGAKMVQ